ncbi:MAG: hypothetical protein AAGA96_06935 [Verrucomicrobiota bacterium]
MFDIIAPVAEIQVFSVSDFDEADALARQEREYATQLGIENFQEISELYHRNPKGFYQSLKHPKVIDLLESILEATPNHLSAQILLDHAKGRGKKVLSLLRSAEFIEKEAYEMVDVIDENGKVSKLDSLSSNQVVEAMSLLRSNREKLDQRTWGWTKSLIAFGTLLNQLQTNPPNSTSLKNKLIDEINAAGFAVRNERQELFQNPEVMEELLQ